MTTVINCPGCQKGLQLPESLVGHEVQCPTCSRTFTAAVDRAPATPPNYAQDEVESRPSRRGSVPPGGNDDYYDETPSRRRARGKPGKVQAISIMMLVGGIYALVHALGAVAASGLACCIWPGVYYAIVMGIMAILRASPLLGETAYLQSAPKAVAIMQIVNIVNLDVVNCVMGILTLVFLNEPEVRRYFRE
jgi:hypothetical protein